MEPTFLALASVLTIHADAIERYGGSPGVRDLALLESALAQPRATFGGQFLHEFPHAMAAAYLFHIVMNHPFVDGNKRAGALTAYAFLEFNGLEFTAEEDEYEALVLAVASGRATKAEATQFFKQHIRPAKP